MASTGSEIAQAYVAVVVRAPGVKKDIERELGAVDGGKSGRSIGQKFGRALSKAAKVGALAAGAAVATIGVAGFKAAAGIETSRKVLGGLYGDATLATDTMRQLRDVAKDSPIDYQAYTKAAESLAYAGITGKDAVGTLKNVGLAITAAGGDSTQLQQAMGGIMKAVNNGGIAMMDSLGMISESGVPILSGLAAKFDTTTDQIKKMASSGKIEITDVMDVLQNATGDTFGQMLTAGEAAQTSFANSWKAAKDSVIVSVGELLVPVLERLAPILQDAGVAVTAFFDGMRTGEGPGGRFAEIVTDIWTATSAFISAASEVVTNVVNWVSANKDWLSTLGVAAGIITGVITAVRIFRGVQLGITAATYGVQGAMLVAGTSAKVYGAIMTAQATTTKVVTVAQKALNLAMRANPIGIIITAITALVGALVWFFTQTDTGKAIWEGFVGFLRDAWQNISSFFVSTYETYIKPVFDGIAAVATWLWETILQPVFNGIEVGFAIMGGILQGIWDFILKPIFDAFGAILKWVWDTVGKPVFDRMKLGIQVMGLVIQYLWVKYVQPAFQQIGAIFQWIWNTIIRPVVDSVKLSLNLLGQAFTWLWQNAVKPALDAVGVAFRWVKDSVIDPIWNGIKNTIKGVWDNGIKPVIDTLVKIIKSDPKEAFEVARDAIGKAWKGIQDLAKKPVKFVVNTVINGLIGTINKIPGVDIPKVKLPKGFHDGGYTGALHPRAVAGVVHGDEHVIRAASRRRLESSHPGVLDHMNRYGEIPGVAGYAKGGYVNPLPRGSYSVTQPFHSGHNGIDLGAATGTPVYSAAKGRVVHASWGGMGGNQVQVWDDNNVETWYAHLSRFSVKNGQRVRAGQKVGEVGSTGMSTGPHLHYMVLPGGWPNYINPAPYMNGKMPPAGKKGSGGWFNPLDGLVDWVANKIKKQFPEGGMWIDAAAGLAKDAAKKAVAAFTDKVPRDEGVGRATLYDNGGWLKPGLSLVENRSGRPEPILTGPQWDSLIEGRGGRSGPVTVWIGDREFEGWMDERADRAVDGFAEGQLEAQRQMAWR